MDNSLKLATLWTTLREVKEKIDNVAVPLATHLSIADPQLMIALEELSERVKAHFERFKLVAEVRRTKQG